MKLICLALMILIFSNKAFAAPEDTETFKMNNSPYPSQYEVFDYGTAPGVNNFEVKDRSGRLIFADHYFDANEVIWVTGSYIIYPQAELNNKRTEAELKQCQETTGGDNLTIYWLGYDLKTKAKRG